MRGADLLVRSLIRGGVTRLFALSGNQIMPIFDACFGRDIRIVHTRHEAAAVHMADAYGRLTGQPGVALVTAGPGFANAISALYVAKMEEAPLVLLSGCAPLSMQGRGAFQEMPQAEMAAHVTKASWTARSTDSLGEEMGRAFRIASSGRPGPVHIALPFDLLNAETGFMATVPGAYAFGADTSSAAVPPLDDIAAAIAQAERPVIITGPAMMRGKALSAANALQNAAGVPVVGMESPRGVNDPALGDFKDVLPQADLVVLLGKKLDYVIQFGTGAALNPNCKFAQIDAEAEAIEHTQKAFDGNSRLVAAVQADPTQAALLLADTLSAQAKSSGWLEEMTTAIAHRPSEWDDIVTPDDMPLHAVDICRAVQAYLDGNPDAIYVSDGGEFGQWAQAYLRAPRRVINGPAGSIGTSIPYAMGAREACPNARIVTMLGDGTFGFHAAEFDTAFRHNIPFIAVVGNDAAWNAEYQIQLHTYGKDRLIGCELLPARYDELAKSLGGYGEYVTSASQMSAAIERAHESGLPACINVSLQRNAAPVAHSGG